MIMIEPERCVWKRKGNPSTQVCDYNTLFLTFTSFETHLEKISKVDRDLLWDFLSLPLLETIGSVKLSEWSCLSLLQGRRKNEICSCLAQFNSVKYNTPTWQSKEVASFTFWSLFVSSSEMLTLEKSLCHATCGLSHWSPWRGPI